MRLAARAVVAVPLLAGVAWLGSYAIASASADAVVYEASKEMGTWSASHAEPGLQTWQWVHDDLARIATLAPSNPTVHELLGMLGSRSIGRAEYAPEAIGHLTQAIALRPTSPYTWANLAEAQYQVGISGTRFEAALVRSSELGPSEPDIQHTVADLGLAVWDEITPETRAAVQRMIAAGVRRNAPEMLQIGERRGRLAIVCRPLEAAPRTGRSKWSQLCEGMEPIP